jgi:alpha-L-fucosidase
MKKRLVLWILGGLFVMATDLYSQTGPETYVWPKDPSVLNNLKKWQGYKFGLLIHMGLYSELGTIESLGLCPEDWVTREIVQLLSIARTTGARNPNSIP